MTRPVSLASMLLGSVLLPASVLAGPWPTVAHPDGARLDLIGQQVRLNGIPMRMERAHCAAPADTVVAHYRRTLGSPVAHSRVGDTQVLARAQGDFFITVTVSPLRNAASEALVAIADMPAARHAAGQASGFVLPAGSELLSDMESIDGQIVARQWVLTNKHGLRANLEHFSARLDDRGLKPDGPPLAESAEALAQGFEGPAGEAKLVLVRHDGATQAVLTVLSRLP
ncbi:hypothetical protein [Thauera sp.]|uniref:hypothetical protein n=1 Tax=Thauera sp. TaxID=1905334 RepID=UPI00262C8CAE|nr:hypothetical protein [Thauera sp.]MCK6408436.1 hypothetical protein [Thauera sp.]